MAQYSTRMIANRQISQNFFHAGTRLKGSVPPPRFLCLLKSSPYFSSCPLTPSHSVSFCRFLPLILRLRLKNATSRESRPPLILLRRLMWLLGCWAEQIPASLRPALVQATANVMKVRCTRENAIKVHMESCR